MIIGLNELDVLIPIERGFSLLPFKNFDIGLVPWHSDKNNDGFSGLGGKDGVFLEIDERIGLLASGNLFIDGGISVGLDIWQSYELLH